MAIDTTKSEQEEVFDLTNQIIAYENGDLDDVGIVKLFQGLIDTGMAWTLQGFYGRTAMSMIEEGLCTPPKAS